MNAAKMFVLMTVCVVPVDAVSIAEESSVLLADVLSTLDAEPTSSVAEPD